MRPFYEICRELSDLLQPSSFVSPHSDCGGIRLVVKMNYRDEEEVEYKEIQ